MEGRREREKALSAADARARARRGLGWLRGATHVTTAVVSVGGHATLVTTTLRSLATGRALFQARSR
jgi:hypothetical protein